MDILKAFTGAEVDSINSIKNLCSLKGIKPYIVGGAVRDAILGNKIKDIDICVEGDPNVILNELRNLKQCEYHSRFQTASLAFKNGVVIDLIRCRKEYYCRDGALPDVFPSHIHEDLYRRDFTVNALAYDIEEKKIIDIYGGMVDLKNKVLRKIHSGSYSEDPTRIFRAVKYAVRYNFKLKDEDEIKACIEKNVLDLVSSDRIIKEIYLLCCEDDWIRNICLCADLKIFDVDKNKLWSDSLNSSISEICGCTTVDVKILRLFYSLKDEKYAKILAKNSILNGKLRDTIDYFNKNSSEIVKSLMNIMDNCRLYILLRKIDVYGLLLLSWNYKLRYKIYNYVYNLCNYRSSLNGENIVSAGVKDGKSIGRILKLVNRVELNTGIKCGQKFLTENLGENI